MFTTKTFLQIARSMLGQMRSSQNRVTDYNVGAVARTLIEAPAGVIDELYQQMAAGLVEGIGVAIYRSFDFELLPQVFANGVLRFTARPAATAAISIPMGFIVSTATGQRFQTVEAGTIPLGQTSASVRAVALVAGPGGNVPADAVNRPVSAGFSTSLAGVTNPEPFGNGQLVETDGERKARFVDFIKALACCTPHAIRYAAKLAGLQDTSGKVVERVVRAVDDETTGYFGLYIYNGTGSTSTALVDATQKIIDGYNDPVSGLPVPGWAPGGMRVKAMAMTETPVHAEIEVEVPLTLRTDALKALIQNAMGAVIRAVPNGGRLRPLDLLNAALALDPVLGGELVAPTLTIPCPKSAVLVPGTLTVRWKP